MSDRAKEEDNRLVTLPSSSIENNKKDQKPLFILHIHMPKGQHASVIEY